MKVCISNVILSSSSQYKLSNLMVKLQSESKWKPRCHQHHPCHFQSIEYNSVYLLCYINSWALFIVHSHCTSSLFKVWGLSSGVLSLRRCSLDKEQINTFPGGLLFTHSLHVVYTFKLLHFTAECVRFFLIHIATYSMCKMNCGRWLYFPFQMYR